MVNPLAVNQHHSMSKVMNRISHHMVKVKASNRSVSKGSHTGKIKVIPLTLVKAIRRTPKSHNLRLITNHRRAHTRLNLDKTSIHRVSMVKAHHLDRRVYNTDPLHLLMAKCLVHLDIILTKVSQEHMDNMDRAGTAVHHMSYKAKGAMVSKASSNKRQEVFPDSKASSNKCQAVILDSILSLNHLNNQAGKHVFLMPLT
jgi:hypothetical protein